MVSTANVDLVILRLQRHEVGAQGLVWTEALQADTRNDLGFFFVLFLVLLRKCANRADNEDGKCEKGCYETTSFH